MIHENVVSQMYYNDKSKEPNVFVIAHYTDVTLC
jgi:hypothetical protein